MKIQRIKLDQLLPNTGQIPGLPINPRQWTKSDIDKIAASLKETPELFEARPIIAVPFEGKYVILGGNLRYEGARQNKDADAPVVVLPADLPVEKMKEIVIKDNGSFGAWDIDALANEWDADKLDAWGVPEWVTGDMKPLDENLPKAGTGEEKKDEFNYQQQFGVIVSCKDELEQQAIYERLTGEGFECRVVSV